MKIKYCSKCVLPNTRPQLIIDEKTGICDACLGITVKKETDWLDRKKLFSELVLKVKNQNAKYDCIIPVSGGKDSTWQVIVALEYGLKPLCVTWKTPARNSIGAKNLQNLINLGVDHIDFSINPKVERKFTLKAFKKLGSPVIPMHMALHAIPLQLAIMYKTPLILWGENSASEYGGDEELKGLSLTRDWLMKYGVTNGTSHSDWIDDDLSEKELAPYVWPSDEEQAVVGVKAVFLGHYFKWDPAHTFEVAHKHGFISAEKAKTGLYAFADIDDAFLITIHHYMKWYKFGFTRLWDNLSLEIRNDRMTRNEAKQIIETAGEENPAKEIELFCDYVGISKKMFFEIANTFRNKDIWKKNSKGVWQIKNFLFENWDWK